MTGMSRALATRNIEFVAAFQSFDGQRESSELVFFVGIRARDVADQFRIELPQSGTQRIIQPGQVVVIADFVRQITSIDEGGLNIG